MKLKLNEDTKMICDENNSVFIPLDPRNRNYQEAVEKDKDLKEKVESFIKKNNIVAD